ncbi:MAG: amidohydrolase family protein [Pirellulaceae bacterium]
MRSKFDYWRRLVGVVGMVCLLAFAKHGVAAGPLAIQNAKIFTVSGEPIEGGTVLIRDGVIEAVGTDVDVPGEARVIDGEGMVVMPGYIDPHNASGMSQANEQNSVVPFLSVVDSIDPIATYFEECLRNGVTTAAVSPGNNTLIGGKAAIVKTAGQYVNDMIVVRDSALKISLQPVSGSRMSHMARLRKELDKAKKELAEELEEESEDSDSKQDQEKKESSDTKKEDDSGDDKNAEAKKAVAKPEDEGMAALKLAISGEMPVYLYCEVAMDVTAAMRLVEDYELEPIFVLGRECHKAAKLLAGSGKTAILDPTLVFWETDPRTREDRKIALPEIYSEAGMKYVFQVSPASSRGTVGSSYFWYQAATAVKYGLSEADALAALTIEPAKLLGIDASVGSIEVGKDADLVVLTGDPLDMASWVQYTIVGGEIVYDRDEDEKLERLLSPSAE